MGSGVPGIGRTEALALKAGRAEAARSDIGDFSMAGFAKLWSTILDSSVWEEDFPTRIVWITLLAMADQDGMVAAVEDAIARRARVSMRECRHALHVFQSPDRKSSNEANEGRRVEKVPGGWLILNYPLYRDKQDAAKERELTRERVRRYRERKKTATDVTPVTPLPNVTVTLRNAPLRQADADTEADTEANTKSTTTTPKARATRAGWVQQLGGLWRRRYGGEPPWGRIAKQLRPVSTENDLIPRFSAYLAATDARYVNLLKFVETFGSWGNGKASPQTYSYQPGITGPEI